MIIIFRFIEAFYKYCNHWVEIIMVFSSAWYFLKRDCVVWAICNFSVREILPFHLFPIPKDYLKMISLALSPWPRTLVRRMQKNNNEVDPSSSSQKNKVSPPFLGCRARVTQAKNCSLSVLLFELSTLSCLQVNLSWGICHGSSCFCI